MGPTNRVDFSPRANLLNTHNAYYRAMLNEQQVTCPYCGEVISVFVDVSQGNHETIEDCFVCCRPIEFLIETDGTDVLRMAVGSGDDVLT